MGHWERWDGQAESYSGEEGCAQGGWAVVAVMMEGGCGQSEIGFVELQDHYLHPRVTL